MSDRENPTFGQITRRGIGPNANHVLEVDRAFKVCKARGTTVPTDGTADYAAGCIFIKSDAAYGMYPQWINLGSDTSCKFRPYGPVMGYGFLTGGGPYTSLGGDTSESIPLQGIIMDSDIAVVGHEVSDDTDQIVAAIANEGSIDITGSADPSTAHGYVYGVLRDKCIPGFDVVAAGIHTTVGGAAAEAITVAGVLATDIAFSCYNVTDDTDVISDVVCTANTITVTCSADPGATHKLNYVVLRPKGDFKPSYYVKGAGVFTTIGGDATEVITVTGAAVGDVVLVGYQTTDDTDSVLSAIVSAANTVTVTLSANPGTSHKLWYVVLSAY